MNKLVSLIATLSIASVFAAHSWLFLDALQIKIEVKTLFKGIGSALIASSFILSLIGLQDIASQLPLWLRAIGFWLIFAAFIFDSHSRLQFSIIIAILATIFLKGHALLAIEALLISIVVLVLARTTKHNDLIPFGVGFILIAIEEFFYSLNELRGMANMQLSRDFLYIFASLSLIYWLWSYLIIRFNLKKSSSKH